LPPGTIATLRPAGSTSSSDLSGSIRNPNWSRSSSTFRATNSTRTSQWASRVAISATLVIVQPSYSNTAAVIDSPYTSRS
jgi:hypothetical protein